MKNNNIQFWVIVIIVALVAGVLGAVVSKGITGNVVRVNNPDYSNCISTCNKDASGCRVNCSNNYKSSKEITPCRNSCTTKATECQKSCSKNADVYTKAEVDQFLKNNIINTLDVLGSKCYNVPYKDTSITCKQVCGNEFKISSTEKVKGIAIGSNTNVPYVIKNSDGILDLEFFSNFALGNLNPIPSCDIDKDKNCPSIEEELMEMENGYGSSATSLKVYGSASYCICCVP